jgi:hypothetical protein
MTLGFSQSTKTVFTGGRSRHQFGVFPGCPSKLAGQAGHDWDQVNSLILIVEIA